MDWRLGRTDLINNLIRFTGRNLDECLLEQLECCRWGTTHRRGSRLPGGIGFAILPEGSHGKDSRILNAPRELPAEESWETNRISKRAETGLEPLFVTLFRLEEDNAANLHRIHLFNSLTRANVCPGANIRERMPAVPEALTGNLARLARLNKVGRSARNGLTAIPESGMKLDLFSIHRAVSIRTR